MDLHEPIFLCSKVGQGRIFVEDDSIVEHLRKHHHRRDKTTGS